jgi:hypothetical protein
LHRSSPVTQLGPGADIKGLPIDQQRERERKQTKKSDDPDAMDTTDTADVADSLDAMDTIDASPSGSVSGASQESELPEGDLYSFVPLKSFKRAIVVYYSAEDAERARMASDRLYIPETPNCPAVTMRAYRAPNTIITSESLWRGSKHGAGISDDGACLSLCDIVMILTCSIRSRARNSNKYAIS